MTFSKLGTDLQAGQVVELLKTSRPQGLYIIGIQGTGKSGLIENLILQDIKQQIGVCVLDPHGELIEHVISRLPGRAEEVKVVLLDITDEDYPFGLNLFTCSNPKSAVAVQYVVDQIMHIFEKLLGVSHDTPLILQYLRNCTYTLIANPGYTMAEIPLLLTDKNCRHHLVANVQRLQTRLFWQQYDQMKPSEQIEQMASIQRRVDDFLQDLILPIVGQAKTTIDLQKIMDEGKILLVKLSPQLDSVSSMIGSLFVALLLNAAYARPPQKRRQFHLYADEFERFATEDFATLLEQARKFGIATTIAHQNRGQLNSANSKLETDLKDRSRSVGNLIVFRVNSKDADDLAGEFQIRPDGAYEEELEAERLEIREPERMETIAVTDGEEGVITFKRDLVGHLLHQGHENSAVEEFVRNYLQPLEEGSKKRDVSSTGFVNVVYGSSVKLTGGDLFSRPGNLFWEWYNDDYKKKVTRGSVDWDLDAFDRREHQWNYDDYGNYSYKPSIVSRDLLLLNDFFYDTMRGKKASTEDELFASGLLNEPGHFGVSAFLGFDTVAYIIRGMNKQAFDAYFSILTFLRDFYEREDHRRIDGLALSNYEEYCNLLNSLQKIAREAIKPRLLQLQTDKHGYDLKLKPKVYDAEMNRYRWFTTSLFATCKALKQNPIRTTESGLYQPRTRQQILMHPEKTFAHPRKAITHPQRPYADIRNEIANELSSLPNFTARVRITVEGQTVEHTIKTLEPEKGLYGKLLQERIARIQAQNRRDGYTRARAAIEAEILQRQTSCSGSAPAQLQSPQQIARHARQVPVQGKCPNCGVSNTPGSKFCNQCGTKL